MARSNDLGREHGATGASQALLLAPGAHRFLVIGTAIVGPVLGWAARHLPWRPEAPLAIVLWALAAANLCTLIALVGSGRRLRLALGALVALSLAAAPLLAGAIVSTSVVMVRLYGPLGWGLTVALAAIGWLLLIATLPIGLVGLHCLRRREATGSNAGA
jgi:hypothetical protein